MKPPNEREERGREREREGGRKGGRERRREKGKEGKGGREESDTVGQQVSWVNQRQEASYQEWPLGIAMPCMA